MTAGSEWSSDGVQLPERIEQAFLSDKLVFFCGAGVSSAPPSKLPGFRGLAEDIAESIGHAELIPADESAPVQFDVVMGKLNEISGDIHRRVSARLRETVTPNGYHRDIWRIATAQTPRIVTTNFDLLFEAAASELELLPTRYVAPALPLGHDFSGLVHLHGVQDPPATSRMVLTDRDFGHAYITEGWATQFLTQMFSKYTVLLIGYSAEDTIIQYLNRALPNDDERFAFTKDTGDYELWRRLGITPIPFPSTPDNEYGALESFVSHWSNRVNATSEERFDQVRKFIDLGPERAMEDPDDTAWLLRDPEFARHFRLAARASEWFSSLDSLGILDELFAENTRSADGMLDWSVWIRASIDDDDGETLLNVLARHQGMLHPSLWSQIWSKLYGDFNATRSHRQLAFILAAADTDRDDSRLSMLIPRTVETDPETAELLLLQLLTPRLGLKVRRAWGLGNDSLETRLRLRWRNSSIRDAWPKLMPQLTDRGHLLSVVLNLIRTVETTDAFFTGRERRDAISARRHQVEHYERFTQDDPYILVVDIARDLLRESVRNHGTRDAIKLLDDRSELITRLALDALAEARSTESDVLIDLLIQRNLSFEYRSRPEAFRLISTAYKTASDAKRHEFLRHVQAATHKGADHEINEYDKYNIFVWLTKTAADDDDPSWGIRRGYEQEQGYEPDESPNLTWGGGTVSFPDSPQEAEGRFRAMAVPEVVRELGNDRTLTDEYSNGQTLRELHDYLDQFPATHLSLLDEMTSQELWSPGAWRTIIQTLVRTPTWQASEILDRLRANRDNASEIAGHIAFSVAYPAHEPNHPLDNEAERTRLLLGLWTLAEDAIGTDAATDPSDARSTTRGSLAHYYTETLLRAAEQQGDEARLTAEGTTGLQTMLTAQETNPADPSPMMVAEYAAHIAFRAPEWFDEHMLARLTVLDGTPQSASLWAGLLFRGFRFRRLRDLLREQIRTGWPQVSATIPASIESYIHVHAACFAFDSDETQHEWPDAFLTHAKDSDRERWIRTVAHYLDGEPPTFQTLLFAHWAHRLDGQPSISQTEQRAFVRWLTLPGIDIEQATALFVRGPAVSVRDEDRYDYYDLEGFPHEEHPRQYLLVANHLMQRNVYPPPFVDQLVAATAKVAPTDAPLARATLSLLLSLGYSPARSLLQDLQVP